MYHMALIVAKSGATLRQHYSVSESPRECSY